MAKQLAKACRRFHLTERELEVLSLLAEGETWKGIAARLGVSISTIRFHSRNMLRKIGAQNAVSAVAKIFLPVTCPKA